MYENSPIYSKKKLEEIKKEYGSATPEQKRAMEIRDLGYPLTQSEEKVSKKEGSE